MEQKTSPTKIIIVTAVIIIIFVCAILGVIFAINSTNNEQDEIYTNIIQNGTEEIEKEDPVIDNENVTIIDDETANFSKRYGKVEII